MLTGLQMLFNAADTQMISEQKMEGQQSTKSALEVF